MNPCDVFYQLLSTSLKPLDKESPLGKIIEEAFKNTQTKSIESEILTVFTIEKASERLRFKPFEKSLNNKFLLWHGLKQCNLSYLRHRYPCLRA